MILKIICFFIQNYDSCTIINKNYIDTETNISNTSKIINNNIKNKYIKSNKNIVKVNYKKSKLYNEKHEEINKYLELSDDNNENNILETDTIKNSNIWKTTTIETDSESSEIEVSKICFN
jgi:hypothetical protein